MTILIFASAPMISIISRPLPTTGRGLPAKSGTVHIGGGGGGGGEINLSCK